MPLDINCMKNFEVFYNPVDNSWRKIGIENFLL
jgi:hypothetical protein